MKKSKYVSAMSVALCLSTMALATSALATPTSKLSASAQVCDELRDRSARDRALSARPSHLDNRLVVFPYHEHGLYTLHLQISSSHTHMEFSPDEQIVASFVNDETLFEQRVVERTLRDVFVRSLVKGATGSVTVITTKRRYQIELFEVSECSNLPRYQRVSWSYAQRSWESSNTDAALDVSMGQTRSGSVPEPSRTSNSVDVSRLNLEYSIEGDAAIKPIRVFDDGTRTWLQFAGDMALRPAIFQVNEEGKGEPVDYLTEGNQFVLGRSFEHGLLLKLGKQEVRIRNLARSSCGWFNKDCRNVRVNNISGEGDLHGH